MVLPRRNQPIWLLNTLFVSLAVLICIADRAPMHMESRFPQVQLRQEFLDYQHGVVNKTLPGPFVYRVLVPHTYAAIAVLMPGVSLISVDLLFKLALLLLCQIAFYKYLQLFFSGMTAFAGVLMFDFLISYSMSYIPGPSVIETIDLLNAFAICLALHLLYKDRIVALFVSIFFAMLNRETPWILLPIMVVNEWFGQRRLTRVLAACLVLATPYLGLRFVIDTPTPTWFTTHDLIFNIPWLSAQTTGKALVANFHFLVLVGPLLTISALRFKEHPRFLLLVASAAPLFIVVHYVFGSIIERRLWIPLYIFLIPTVLSSLSMILTNGSPSRPSR